MIQIIFQDNWVLALHKPSGLPSESQNKEGQETAEDLVRQGLGESPIFLCHRLDTGTSGVLLFAKTPEVFGEIRQKFKNREVRKHYLAFCEKSQSQFPINRINYPFPIQTPLAHHPKSKKRMIPLPEGLKRSFRGKPLPAHSIIHGMEESVFGGVPCLKLRVEIKTGVMHQIRVHLSHQGYPILGDSLYGEKPTSTPRLALHAESLEFELRGFRYYLKSDLNPLE
jgi:23S rRNA-/tRNA-specific pseudouridylate synthase